MELRNKTRQTGLILVGQQFEEQDLVISPVLFVHMSSDKHSNMLR